MTRLFPGLTVLPERTYLHSRFDFCLEQKDRRIFVEVKGVTLERDGLALFPDAPTERGRRHMTELAEAVKAGAEAYVLFLVQMKGCRRFSPNDETDPGFAAALREARENGVGILCYDCAVTPDSMT
ncbi:DNA/RNA nuclease SfsA, partial [Vibrio sp. FNV 38]|nr:DNA/RNA nuclease SfsA [Vibrio sp. FNV 38]